jgi:hypothetical protein
MITSTPTKNSLSKIALISALLAASSIASSSAQTLPPQSDAATIFLIDDQTGLELAEKHGIQPLAVADLDALINAVLNGKTPVRLFHQAVDEDATDNATSQMEFRPYTAVPAPTPLPRHVPLVQLARAEKKYRADRAEWQSKLRQYAMRLSGEVESFIRQVTATQGSVAKRFDDMLAARNGRDFNRSDILGCVLNASRMLGPQGRRFLVCNSDLIDCPGKRKPRTTALTAQELDPAVELIFVNTSRLPETAPMFAGLPNRRHHANSMAEAMELIISQLAPVTDTPAPGGDSGPKTPGVTRSANMVTPQR